MAAIIGHSTRERMIVSQTTELDYRLLQQLMQEPAASQRTLAARLGISVGKLNFCLRALVDKGWVKAQNFRRNDNKLAYAYLLTPQGLKAKLQLTSEFLARKEGEFESLRRQIHALRDELALVPDALSAMSPQPPPHNRRSA